MKPIEGTPEAKNAILHQGELSLMLTVKEGEPITLRDVTRAWSALDGLLRAIAKEIAPTERLVPVVVRVDLLDERLRLTVRIQPDAPAKRRKAARR